MTADIFTEWLKKIDKTTKGQNCKFLLYMYQCTVRTKQADFLKNANVLFISENCIGQPHLLDLSCNQEFKGALQKAINSTYPTKKYKKCSSKSKHTSGDEHDCLCMNSRKIRNNNNLFLQRRIFVFQNPIKAKETKMMRKM